MASTEISRVLGEYAAAWREGDLARIVAAYHDDFVLHYFGRSPLAGTHTGKAAALAVLGEATRLSNRRLVTVEDVLAGDDLGALVVLETVGAGEEERQIRRVLLYRVHDGRLRECWLFDEDQRLVDRLWGG